MQMYRKLDYQKRHIERAWFEAAPQGDYIALRSSLKVAPVGGKRGKIRTFSRNSRSRLMKRISQTQKHRIPLFVTLTYPNEYPLDFKVYKGHLHDFFMSLKYFYPDYGAIWRLEYQERGAAHFHLFLWGIPLQGAQDLIPRLWYQVAGGSDPLHLAFHQGNLTGSKNCVEVVKSWRGVKSYASKYLTKLEDKNNPSGRYWGCVGLVPMSHIMTMEIDIETAVAFRRAFRKKSGFSNKRFGFWAYGFSVAWLRFVDDLQTEFEDRNIPDNYPPGWWRGLPGSNEVDFF